MVDFGSDLRERTLVLCAVLALAIAVSVLLRGRRPVRPLFAAFAADIALWYLAQSLYGFFQASIWARVTALLAILLPQFAIIIYIRISNWKTDNEAHKDLFMFGITLLMSLWTSLLLLAACNFVFKEPLCTDNRRNGFIISNFFFPMFIVFVSWIMNLRPKSI